jgi:multidrug efflux pump subunit AcrB
MSGAVAGCFIVQRFARNGGQYAPGREIEGPMAQVILGGLITSVALNLVVLPTLALRFGCFTADSDEEPAQIGWR